ncbi:Cilia- and flagella-associated protein 53 [Irineochytrium annulatum]|nr:Cilia- and flagella-associated protein 53 [Irineochytrium annulatum]
MSKLIYPSQQRDSEPPMVCLISLCKWEKLIYGPVQASKQRSRVPQHQKSDYLITNRRREEEIRSKMLDRTNYYSATAMKSTFEETSTNAIRRNHLSRRVEELKAEGNIMLDARRDRLKELLADDDHRYAEELLRQEETQGSRLEQMKARMQELRSKREEERKQVVHEKLHQRWRAECDELRHIESKVLEKEVALKRGDQLLEREEQRAIELEDKRFYDDLWEKDRLRKIAHEEGEKARQKDMNFQTTAVLEAQMELLKSQALQEEKLKQEEAALMRQEMKTREIEDERKRQRKLAEQRIIRAELDKFNKMKVEARAREIRESLELDLKIVNEFFKMDASDAESKSRKRAEQRRDMQLYREHLMEQQKIEKEREKEIEKMQKDESDKLWRIRAEKWQKEQRARDQLMREVISGRREQLQQSLDANRHRIEETRREREYVLQQLEAARRVEAADKIHKDLIAQGFKDALLAQMEAAEDRKRDERRRIEAEGYAEKIADQRYRELLEAETKRALISSGINRVKPQVDGVSKPVAHHFLLGRE